jgi:hypothetical protein
MPVYTYTTLYDPLATGGSHPRSINATGQILGITATAATTASS